MRIIYILADIIFVICLYDILNIPKNFYMAKKLRCKLSLYKQNKRILISFLYLKFLDINLNFLFLYILCLYNSIISFNYISI